MPWLTSTRLPGPLKLDHAVSSVRLEQAREGEEDYEYLHLLRQLVDRGKAAGRSVSTGEKALAAAIADLARQTGLPGGDIHLASIEATNWNDSSLGCPQEGFMYAQVITPGYLIMLEAQGQQYEYHADQAAMLPVADVFLVGTLQLAHGVLDHWFMGLLFELLDKARPGPLFELVN